ncbi:basic proline-rich protein-like [Caloenas nicobarica]|uniref:basic proline-rich protein-like n=1 Tax=Caloenas nicobarica TaxID=187106 RepID=UPI0032B707E4
MASVSSGVPTQNRTMGWRHPSHLLPPSVQGGQWDTIAPMPGRYQSLSPRPGLRAGSRSLSHLVPRDPRGADAGQGLASRDFGPRPAVTISGQGKDRPAVNGARPGPARPCLPALPRLPVAPEPGARPRARPRRDRPPEAPGSPQPGPEAPPPGSQGAASHQDSVSQRPLRGYRDPVSPLSPVSVPCAGRSSAAAPPRLSRAGRHRPLPAPPPPAAHAPGQRAPPGGTTRHGTPGLRSARFLPAPRPHTRGYASLGTRAAPPRAPRLGTAQRPHPGATLCPLLAPWRLRGPASPGSPPAPPAPPPPAPGRRVPPPRRALPPPTRHGPMGTGRRRVTPVGAGLPGARGLPGGG